MNLHTGKLFGNLRYWQKSTLPVLRTSSLSPLVVRSCQRAFFWVSSEIGMGAGKQVGSSSTTLLVIVPLPFLSLVCERLWFLMFSQLLTLSLREENSRDGPRKMVSCSYLLLEELKLSCNSRKAALCSNGWQFQAKWWWSCFTLPWSQWVLFSLFAYFSHRLLSIWLLKSKY